MRLSDKVISKDLILCLAASHTKILFQANTKGNILKFKSSKYLLGHATGHGDYNRGVSIYISTGIRDSRENIFKARIVKVIADLNSRQLYMNTGKSWPTFPILNKDEVPY